MSLTVRRSLVYFALLSALAQCATTVPRADAQRLAAAASDRQLDDYWDEEAKETPVQPQSGKQDDPPTLVQGDKSGDLSLATSTFNSTRPVTRSLFLQALGQTKPYREGLLLVVLALFVFNIFKGRRENKNLAASWATTFCDQGGLFDRNFSQVGTNPEPGSPLLIRHSSNTFLFYATGRRFCQSLTAHLDLVKRQDLLSFLIRLVSPSADTLDIEVEMSDSHMPPFVLAIGAPKIIRNLSKDEDNKELEELSRKIDVANDKLPGWPADKLAVFAEHSSNLYDLLPESVMDQVFGRAAFEASGRYFRYLLFSSERKTGPKNVLKFSFYLPDSAHMDDLASWMAAVMSFIDSVGTHKMPPEQKKRAEKARHELEQKAWKDPGKERQQAMEDRRESKRREEQERLRKMDPDTREKEQQRKAKLAQKRAMRGKVIRA